MVISAEDEWWKGDSTCSVVVRDNLTEEVTMGKDLKWVRELHVVLPGE